MLQPVLAFGMPGPFEWCIILALVGLFVWRVGQDNGSSN